MNWTPEERKFMEENYGRLTQKQMAKALGRGSGTISRMAELFDLQKKPKIRKEPQPRYQTLQWQKGKHLQGIWNVRPPEVHLGQRS